VTTATRVGLFIVYQPFPLGRVVGRELQGDFDVHSIAIKNIEFHGEKMILFPALWSPEGESLSVVLFFHLSNAS
jgi:hypothetical protein